MTRRPRRAPGRAREASAVALVLASLAATTIGCSWLIGVSGDPVVSDGFGDDASDEADTRAASPPIGFDADRDARDAADDVDAE